MTLHSTPQQDGHTVHLTPRAHTITSVLLKHGTVPGPACHCGHVYRLGDSIAEHRAAAVDAALTIAEQHDGPDQHDEDIDPRAPTR